jgi:hypothetical protein
MGTIEDWVAPGPFLKYGCLLGWLKNKPESHTPLLNLAELSLHAAYYPLLKGLQQPFRYPPCKGPPHLQDGGTFRYPPSNPLGLVFYALHIPPF